MKVTLLLIGSVCMLSCAAQSNNPNLLLPQKKNVLAEILKESRSQPKQKAIHDFSFQNKGTLLIGNEARGVADELLNIADGQISIPSYGQAESLNAAVATGILLWEAVRGRK